MAVGRQNRNETQTSPIKVCDAFTEALHEVCPSLPTGDARSCVPTVRLMGEDRCHSFCLCFILKFSQLYSMFMLLYVCPPFLCMCVGISANRSVRWDAAESSCHSLMSKLAAFTFHLQSLETVWPEWSYRNVLSHCRVGHLTLHAHSHTASATQLIEISTKTVFNIKILIKKTHGIYWNDIFDGQKVKLKHLRNSVLYILLDFLCAKVWCATEISFRLK